MAASVQSPEQIATQLLADSSRASADFGASILVAEPSLLQSLMLCIAQCKGSEPMRAANIIEKAAAIDAAVINSNLPELLDILLKTPHHGVRRCLLKLFMNLSNALDEDSEGLLTEKCFVWLNDPLQTIAVKFYAMEILIKIGNRYPDLMSEIAAVIEEQSLRQSASFASRAKKELRKLYR